MCSLLCIGVLTSTRVHAQVAEKDTLIPNSMIRPMDYRPITLKPHPFLLPIARAAVRGSYPLELSYTKTSHIIFPSRIIDFDAGSETILAMVPETIRNVLRIKSDTHGFQGETNMTVFTEEGGLYSFLVRYNENPDVFTLDLGQNGPTDNRTVAQLGIGGHYKDQAIHYIFPEGRPSEQLLVQASQKAMAEKNFIRHVGTRINDLQVRVRGIFLGQENTLFLKLEMKNQSYLPYHIDFIKLFVRDRNQLKRSTVQQEELPLLGTYPENLFHLKGHQKIVGIIALPFRTLGEGKILEVEIYEKNGGRHLTFPITQPTLLRAKPL